MKILIAGAGATGGAFGTRLFEAGRDVTFFVREARAQTMRANGLRFVAPGEDRTNHIPVLTAAELATANGSSSTSFDLVIVAVKANGLESIIDDIRPAVGRTPSSFRSSTAWLRSSDWSRSSPARCWAVWSRSSGRSWTVPSTR